MSRETDDPSKTQEPRERVPTGALTALLQQLVADPTQSAENDWQITLAAGGKVGRFQLLRELGRGGFGVVFEALDTALDRKVALKAVRTGGQLHERQERLLKEAEAAAKLLHPNIVTLFDLGRCESGPYLVLELLQGRSLAERQAAGPLPVAEAVRIATEVARGLAFAHGQGVIHRDLSAGNVFLCDDGAVKLLDFGMAHAFGHRRLSGGTPAFMAPEQWTGAPEDERTDVFALGVNLYRMLTGAHPFAASDDGKALTDSRPAPELEVPEAPALGALVGRMLEKNPVKRPRDGAEVLARLLEIGAALARVPGVAVRPVKARRRPAWRLPALVAAGVVLGGLAAAVALRLADRPAAEVAPEGRLVVAVADVANRTGDAELDGLSGLLIASLEQSRRFGVLTRARMSDLARQAGRADAARIDEVLGREICRRGLAKALIVAAVHRIGSVYSLELRALDPGQDAYLFTLHERADSKEGLLAAIDRISLEARRALREPGAEVEAARRTVASLVTGNLDAFRHYASAQRHLDGVRYAEAVLELRTALGLDPEFALAHYLLARLGRVGEIGAEERDHHAREALRLKDRLPEKERRLLLARTALREGRVAEGEAAYRALTADFPDDKEVAYELGKALLDRDAAEEAVPFLTRAAELDPTSVEVVDELLETLGWLGRTEELLAIARRGRAAVPGPQTAALEAEAMIWAGRYDEAVRLATEAREQGEPQGRVIKFDALLRARDFLGMEVEVAAARASDQPELRLAAPYLEAVIHAATGRRRRALEAVAARRSAGAGNYPAYDCRSRVGLLVGLDAPDELRREVLALQALDPALAGKAAAAVAWAGDLEMAALLAKGLPAGSAEAALHRAVADWRAGRLDAALPELRRLASSHVSGTSLDVLFHGEAALEAGRAEEAAKALRRFRGLLLPARWEAWARPWSELRLAEAELALGNTAKAREVADRLAVTWKEADPDYGPARRLRALRERLGR